jgi:DNA-binding LacI/PurR family transcriptional regulator
MATPAIRSVDVARLAGVSRSAVSRAYTEGAYIAPETKRKVMQAAERLGYQPNAIARSLITNRTNIVGVVTAGLDNWAYAVYLESIGRHLQAQGFASLVMVATDLGETDSVVSKLLTYQVDGLILTAAPLSSTVAAQCERAGKPVVFVNRYTDVDHFTSIVNDNVQGGREVADLLVELGYERIAFIAGLETTSDGRDRARGFRERMAELGRAGFVTEPGFYSHQGATDAARRLLGKFPRPDAIFCANDVMAAAAIDVARVECGLRVPEDVAFVGYDNSRIAEWPAYSLTSMDHDIPEMARLAVEAVINADAAVTPDRRIVIPSRLVIRGSTRKRA